MIKFGIIGCGWITEKVYFPLLNKMANASIYAIYDNDEKLLLKVKKKYNIPMSCNCIEDFLNLVFDAVIIATPNSSHTYYSKLALSAKKHVLCEKPVAFTKLDIEKTISIARKNNKIFLPALVNRFRDDIIQFQDKSQSLGEIQKISVSWNRKSGIPKLGSWITNKEQAGGGVLIDIGTHVIDIGLGFVKEKEIKSLALNQGAVPDIEENQSSWNVSKVNELLVMNVETWAQGQVKFKNTVLNFSVSWCSKVDEDVTCIVLYGENGILYINTLFGFSKNFNRQFIKIVHLSNSGPNETAYLHMNNSYAVDAFEKMLNYFILLINGKEASILRMEDAVPIVEVIEKLYRNGKEIIPFTRHID